LHVIFRYLSPPPLKPPLFPYTTLFRSELPANLTRQERNVGAARQSSERQDHFLCCWRMLWLSHDRREGRLHRPRPQHLRSDTFRSEEHTSELQSRGHLVCRLLLEKKK